MLLLNITLTYVIFMTMTRYLTQLTVKLTDKNNLTLLKYGYKCCVEFQNRPVIRRLGAITKYLVIYFDLLPRLIYFQLRKYESKVNLTTF